MTISALLLAGCDGGDPGPAAGDDTHSAPASAAATADGAPRPRTAFPIGTETPFTPYGPAVNAVVNGPAPDEATARARYEAIQHDTAACMKDAGFEYRPDAFEKSETLVLPWTRDSLPLPVLPESRGDAERWGYGTDDVDGAEADRAKAESVDENSAYVATLSEKAQSAYQLVLTGSHGPDDPAPEPDGGCAGRAESAHPGPVVDESLSAQFVPLIRAMGDVVQRDLTSDPATHALDEEWTACMLEAGVDVEPPAEFAQRSSLAPMDAYTLAVLTPPDGAAQWPKPDETADQIPVERRYLVGSDAEHRIAVADFDCRASTRYVERVTQVLVRLETDFVAGHQGQLTSLLAAAGTH